MDFTNTECLKMLYELSKKSNIVLRSFKDDTLDDFKKQIVKFYLNNIGKL